MAQASAQISPSAREAVCEALNQGVAETAVATMLAQNFHWNVTGMGFGTLHALFQTIYEDHFVAQDDLAERIKALDGHAEGQLSAMLKRSKVAEHDGHAKAEEMIAALLTAQETLAATMAGIAAVAEENGDLLTQDLAISRGQTHEKFAWMLRAHLR
ncbi:Dps family protein [Pseudorhodobacter sp. MZDSW-24AT]|uniref:Dps family protein n=1 Tax=Pseudorhodobacter sp. MZDSW-24AT TaxID=2052957 RepID=UPI000C1F0496|nr:DNA starvation/stationary phase protection protein [Pseudorhodobacter sp. MZDSW-24AT]PJF10549.1 DNA starvation/stationary phase protection protein [Pseudorhodobacter sp. MZDSW-24AT]